MVSRRNFFGILVMMAVLLFMFQFSSVIKENESDYNINAYGTDEVMPIRRGELVLHGDGAAAWGDALQDTAAEETDGGDDFVVFCGSAEGAVCRVVKEWCGYTKRGMVVCDSPAEYVSRLEAGEPLPQVLLVDSQGVNLADHVQALYDLTDMGITLVFCNLPDASVIAGEGRLRKLLGIQQVLEEQVEVEGIHLFAGFLLGGEARYIVERQEDEKRQDLELTVPWYVTAGGTKTYMAGILDELLKDNEAKNEYAPAIVWRNGYGDSKIFVVNGDYLSRVEGIGILDGMMYEAQSYSLYPVVNAQNVVVTNYPEFAGENEEVMRTLYSRRTEAVQRDICWPDIGTLVEKNNLKLTCMFTPQYQYFDESEPSGEDMVFYLQQLREADAEAGISLALGEGVSLWEKLERDEAFFSSFAGDYRYSTVYAEADTLSQTREILGDVPLLKDVRTIACDYEFGRPLLSWYEAPGTKRAVTMQSITSDVSTHTYSDDFFVRSLETALGYSNVKIEMHNVVWPRSEEDRWEKMYDNISSNLNTFWRAFAVFSRTTLTESDERIRNFLNLDYEDEREGDVISLRVWDAGESWFLLRVHGEEIVSISGAEYEEVESGSYLLYVTEENVEIGLRRIRGQLKYLYP